MKVQEFVDEFLKTASITKENEIDSDETHNSLCILLDKLETFSQEEKESVVEKIIDSENVKGILWIGRFALLNNIYYSKVEEVLKRIRDKRNGYNSVSAMTILFEQDLIRKRKNEKKD